MSESEMDLDELLQWDADPPDDDLLIPFAGIDAPAREDETAGSLEVELVGDELLLAWRSGFSAIETVRYDASSGVLRIFPRVRYATGYVNPFDSIVELQLEGFVLDLDEHSEAGRRDGALHLIGLPRGFSAVYEYGLGVQRPYRGLLEEIENRTHCTAVRFIRSGSEGIEGSTFRIGFDRFERYRALVDRNRDRAATALERVIVAERHNLVADLFDLEPIRPRFGRHRVIQAMTEEVLTGHLMTDEDREALIDETTYQAPRVAKDSPERFGRLREDIELVSLDVLIGQFERGMSGRSAHDENHWQDFFAGNPFALQQVFAAPILVLHGQVHVRGTDALGRGARIADFLCVNAVTRSAVVVEIKTPDARLMAPRAYRGSGSSEVYPAHADLSGAVSQVQAQMESVPRDLKETVSLGEIDRWHVQGAVISGQVSKLNKEQRDSFLRYREGFSAVTILGYDEVLARLKALRTVLVAPAPPR